MLFVSPWPLTSHTTLDPLARVDPETFHSHWHPPKKLVSIHDNFCPFPLLLFPTYRWHVPWNKSPPLRWIKSTLRIWIQKILFFPSHFRKIQILGYDSRGFTISLSLQFHSNQSPWRMRQRERRKLHDAEILAVWRKSGCRAQNLRCQIVTNFRPR